MLFHTICLTLLPPCCAQSLFNLKCCLSSQITLMETLILKAMLISIGSSYSEIKGPSKSRTKAWGHTNVPGPCAGFLPALSPVCNNTTRWTVFTQLPEQKFRVLSLVFSNIMNSVSTIIMKHLKLLSPFPFAAQCLLPSFCCPIGLPAGMKPSTCSALQEWQPLATGAYWALGWNWDYASRLQNWRTCSLFQM